MKISNRFSLKTGLQLLTRLITTMLLVHRKGIVHRDLKPENILVGPEGKEDQIYLVDFGVSKIYIENGKHMYDVHHHP
jgi:serine/threonine protein kinase